MFRRSGRRFADKNMRHFVNPPAEIQPDFTDLTFQWTFNLDRRLLVRINLS